MPSLALRRLCPPAALLLALFVPGLALSGCQGPQDQGRQARSAGVTSAGVTPAGVTPTGAASLANRPRLRSGGPRLPPHSGANPAALGWEQRGEVWLRPGAPARLRTRHVDIRSDAPLDASLEVARRAQVHVQALFAQYGDALDLRLPTEPLPIEVYARRASFAQALSRSVPSHPRWGAFYDSRSGTVHVSIEPAPQGALPLAADIRHEMTHQILDLSTPPIDRVRIYRGEGLWLWEGFAAFGETLGDGPGEDHGRLRRERFAKRRARGEVAPLSVLFHLDQAAFEGRHYDQAAVLTAWLMADGFPGSRSAVTATLRDMLRGRMSANAFERVLGRDAAAIDRAWRATW